MKLLSSIVLIVALAIISIDNVRGYNILGIFPMISRSHYIVGHALLKGLADAGHEVTMISPFKEPKPIPNYNEVVLEGLIQETFKSMRTGHGNINQFDRIIHANPIFSDLPDSNFLNMNKKRYWEHSLMLYFMGEAVTNLTLTNVNYQKFINTQPKPKFDVVIVEVFVSEALLALGHLYSAPVIGVSTFGAFKWTTDLVGTPNFASYVPHTFLGYSDRMTFWQRLTNAAAIWFDDLVMPVLYEPRQRALYDRHFGGPGKPTFDEIKRNVSLVLLNTHVSLGFPRPYAPNMIEVGGMHIKKDSKQKLPADIQKFLDGAHAGAIYFSMGSNIKSTMFKPGALEELFQVFAEFKGVRVIFKGEAENAKVLQSYSNNTLIQAWYPQEAVLAHPNLKLFITHGGLLSTTESVVAAVPVIGIPVFGDQSQNMLSAESAGYGVKIDFPSLNGDTMREAIKKVLYNPSYSRVAKAVSSRFHDQINTPLETAVFWVEYVARHGGCPHLRSSSIDFPFYKLYNLDVSVVLLLIILAPFLLLAKLWAILRSKRSVKSQPKRKVK